MHAQFELRPVMFLSVHSGGHSSLLPQSSSSVCPLPIPISPINPSNLSFYALKHPELFIQPGRRPSLPGRLFLPSSGTRSAATVAAESLVDGLDEVKVVDLSGNEVPISDLWKDRKAVVAFARHFGCVLCRKRADYLAEKKEQMDAAGATLVLIGPGSVEQARVFYEQTRFKGEVYADPSYSSYKALKFVSGVTTTFTPKAGLKIIQLYMEGYRQDWELSFEKDTRERGGWQQGGILVAGPGRTNILYVHKDKEAGDDPPVEDVMRACCPSA